MLRDVNFVAMLLTIGLSGLVVYVLGTCMEDRLPISQPQQVEQAILDALGGPGNGKTGNVINSVSGKTAGRPKLSPG